MKAKRRALIPALLSGILALGLLARSSTRLAMDLLYPFSTADTAAHELRIFWKQLGEGICGALYAVYLLGLLVLLCLAWSGKLRVRCSSALLFLLSQGGLALLCTLRLGGQPRFLRLPFPPMGIVRQPAAVLPALWSRGTSPCQTALEAGTAAVSLRRAFSFLFQSS